MSIPMSVLPSDYLDQLMSLRGAWAGTRAAAGGLNAMVGFEFQLTKAAAVIIEQAGKGAGVTFVEALSDIVHADDGVIIAQAKRTLSSGAFLSGLAELWEIEKLAIEKTPELAPFLRYEIQSAKRTLKDWQASLGRWTPEGGDQVALDAFKAKVGISVQPEPRLEAARLLVRDFKDEKPFDRIDQFLGRILSASSGSLDRVVDEFRTELDAQRSMAQRLDARFQLWGNADRAPDQVLPEPNTNLAVRLGEKLNLGDLREGRLGDRQIYSRIARSCEQWLAVEGQPYKLPVYWLSGRSGCGKSAALLHLGARVYAEDPSRLILWLGEHVDWISDAVRWATPRIERGRSVIILLDDPFTAARQQTFAREVEKAQYEWEQIRASGARESLRPPVIICCGPTEQRAAAQDVCGEHIACDGFDLPVETEDDLAELAAWYAKRMGRFVEPLAGNVLLVQQVFEWTKGSIRDFATRFRNRIRAFDENVKHGPVFATVAQILALNRLYVDYPAGHLAQLRKADPALDSALILIGEEEQHLDFDAGPRGGVRLTHPHLANAIYMEWFGLTTERPFRRQHLERALAAALDQNEGPPELRHAPLWSIARLAQKVDQWGKPVDSELNDRVDVIRDELRDVLTDVYRARAITTAPLEDLPVWLVLNDELELELSPDPTHLVISAIDAAIEPCRGLRLSCHRLLVAKGDVAANHAAVADCLNRLATWRDGYDAWYDWAPLSIDFVLKVGLPPIAHAISKMVSSGAEVTQLPALIFTVLTRSMEGGRQIAMDWLARTPSNDLNWARTLQRAQGLGQDSDSDAAAQRFLLAEGDSESWAFIWLNLLDGGRGDRSFLLKQGNAWIGSLGDAATNKASWENLGWDRVWQKLYEQRNTRDRKASLRALGLAWIIEVDAGHEGWTHVWRFLLEDADGPSPSSDLFELAEKKLAEAPPWLMGWSYVWMQSIGLADDRVANLIVLAKRWLQQADAGHQGWGYVWQKLVQICDRETCELLMEAGFTWLLQVSIDHHSWGFVWSDLHARIDPKRKAVLVNMGVDWLDRADPAHSNWPRVATSVLAITDGEVSAAVKQLVSSWLPRNLSHPGASHVVDGIVSQAPELCSVLQQDCLAILEDDAADPVARCAAWEVSRKLGVSLPRLMPFAVSLLAEPAAPRTAVLSICGRSLRTAKKPEHLSALVDAAWKLLASPYGTGWAWLWEGMLKKVQPPEKQRLESLAIDWLKGEGQGHRRWAIVLSQVSTISNQAVKHPEIVDAMHDSLQKMIDSRTWTTIWSLIPERKEVLTESRYRNRALSVLRTLPEDKHWGALWLAVEPVVNSNEKRELIALAEVWLSAGPQRQCFPGAWAQVLDHIIHDDPQTRRRMVSLGLEVLSLQPLKRSWFDIFCVIADADKSALVRPAVLASAVHWLATPAKDMRGWPKVCRWRASYEPDPWTDAGVRAASVMWLSTVVVQHSSWSRIWTGVSQRATNSEKVRLFQIGMGWLRDVSWGSPGWAHVWTSLWKLYSEIDGARSSLKEIGNRWLDSNPADFAKEKVAVRLKRNATTAQRPPFRGEKMGKQKR